MRTLTKLGRQIICERLGIYDENSIFIHDVKAFVDRVELLSLSTDVLKWIDAYKKELSTFKTEEEYVAFLDTNELKLYSILSEIIYSELSNKEDEEYTNVLQTDFKYNFDLENNILSLAIDNSIDRLDLEDLDIDVTHEINIDSESLDSDDINCIRIYSDSIVYAAIKYLCLHYEFPDRLSTFIENNTGSKYLATMTDLNLYHIDYRLQKRISKEIDAFLCSMVAFISPKYINPKSLIGIDKRGLFFITSPNIPVNTIDKIHNAIKDCDTSGCENLDTEICKFLIIDNILCIKNSFGKLDVISDDDLDVINITRMYRGETPSVYDSYFQINGREAMLLSNYT